MRCQTQCLPRNGDMQFQDMTTRWQSGSAHREGWGCWSRALCWRRLSNNHGVGGGARKDELMSLWLEKHAGADPGVVGPDTYTTWRSCL